MQNIEKDQNLPVKAGDEDNQESEREDFFYTKSSLTISISIIAIILLIAILITSILIRTFLHSHDITGHLLIYLGFTSNKTIAESKLTYWKPKSIHDEQPIENISSYLLPSTNLSSFVVLSQTEKRALTVFRYIILPSVFLLSIVFGLLAYYIRGHFHHYPAWGSQPKTCTNL